MRSRAAHEIINEALSRTYSWLLSVVIRVSTLIICDCLGFHRQVVDMEPLHVDLCDHCRELVFDATVPTTIQRRTSLKVLLSSSGSCHCCSTLRGVLAHISSKVRSRFDFSDNGISEFPLIISHTATQRSAGGIHSKEVTATLELTNEFHYSSEVTIAWCSSDCKAVTSQCPGLMD